MTKRNNPQRNSAVQTVRQTVRQLIRSMPLAAGVYALSVPHHTLAQEAAESEGLQEIVVTAQKREESLTDVPISITAITAEDIEKQRIKSVDDFIPRIPNATLTRGNNLAPDVTLRGISIFAGGQFDPIGVVVDDSGFGATNISTILSARFFDIERIEVLRGPQGTLTGRNSLGGTINIVTAKPDVTDFEAKTTLDLSRYDSVFAQGVVNVPVNEVFALRASTYIERSEGAVKNIGPTGGSSDTENFGGRIAARWFVNSQLTLDAAFGYEKQRYGLDPSLPRDIFPDDESGEFRAAAIAAFEALGSDYFNTDFYDRAGSDGGTVRLNLTERLDVTDWIGSFRAAYQFGSHKLDAIYGHFDYDARGIRDRDESELAIARFSRIRLTTADSAELRLTSEYDGAINWVGGVSYLYEKNPSRVTQEIGDGTLTGTDYSVDNVLNFTDLLLTTDLNPVDAAAFGDVLGERFGFDSLENQFIRSYGVFGNLFWDLNDRTHLSVGTRVSFEETGREFSVGGETLIGNSEYTKISPRVALNFDLNEDVTTYAQVATGYRGGYGADPRAVALGLVPAEVRPEEVINYELGLKGKFLDNRARVSAALFYMDYEDLQVSGYVTLDDGSYVYVDLNASEAYVRGFEIEAAFLPVSNLEMGISAGYTESNIDELPAITGSLDFDTTDDVEIPGVRPWTTNFFAEYSRPLNDDWTGNIRVDYSWLDRAFQSTVQQEANELPRYDTVDLAIGFSSDKLTVSAYGENIFDNKYWTGTNSFPLLRGTGVLFVPRTFGIRMSYNFQ
jgi:iron complex outermembrane recepter protein